MRSFIKTAPLLSLLCAAVFTACSSQPAPATTQPADTQPDASQASDVQTSETTSAATAQTAEIKPEFAHLRTDIIGLWVVEGGPEEVDTPMFGMSYAFIEFTSDNKVVNHYGYTDADGHKNDGSIESGTYRIDDDMLVYEKDNVGTYIKIDGNIMTTTNNSGSRNYVKLTKEQATDFGIYYTDEKLAAEQKEYVDAQNAEADAEVSAAAEDTEGSEETEAAE
ncbi:MAG: lipocalin family protein [Oscillospiraceae bacterium]|nr:lipocalin family protein [Oscillospiraceae bacterium]